MTKKSPFDALEKLRDALPPGPAPATPPETAPTKHDPFAAKIVIAKTRKGRGGRTVTAVDGVRLQGDALAELAREIAKALGCGASVEDGRIIVQGEQQERLRLFFAGRGARKIVIGA